MQRPSLSPKVLDNTFSSGEEEDDGSGKYPPVLDIFPVPRGITIRQNGRSTILLLDSQRSSAVEMECGSVPNGIGVAIKVHRSQKEFKGECAYYMKRAKGSSEGIHFYGVVEISSLLPDIKTSNKCSCGIVLERLDYDWLMSTRGARLLQLGPRKNDIAALSTTQKIKVRMLLWRSASSLAPEHGQINTANIIIIFEARQNIRAHIIDFGDRSEPVTGNLYTFPDL